jgi:formylglycine-generating enzyme required for sulfatase activity
MLLVRTALLTLLLFTVSNLPAQTKVNPKDGLTYVWISPGHFKMGCSPDDTECNADEKPPREVAIAKGFWLGQTLVTQAAYEKVTGRNPSTFKGDRLPVETINWDDAIAYCEAAGGRLPTETEWEYAARAGTTGVRYGNLNDIAWYAANSGNKTHETAQKAPNAYGLYDMLGNLWEWLADTHEEGKYRPLRGGSWGSTPRDVRVSFRYREEVHGHYNAFGIRCAQD